MSSQSCGAISFLFDFAVVHAVADSAAIEHVVYDAICRQNIPVQRVHTYEDLADYSSHPESWLIGPSRARDKSVDVPATHDVLRMCIRSRGLTIGLHVRDTELGQVLRSLLALSSDGIFVITTKQERLKVNLCPHEASLDTKQLMNVCYMVTAFERCFDGLLMAHCTRNAPDRYGYVLHEHLNTISRIKDIDELKTSSPAISAGPASTDAILQIESDTSFTFGNHHSTLKPERILMWCSILNSLLQYCCDTSDSEVISLLQVKMYDIKFCAADLLTAIGAKPEVQVYYEERRKTFDYTQAVSETAPYDTSTVATGSLPLTLALRRHVIGMAKLDHPRRVQRAMKRKFDGGGYGIDFLQHNGGKASLPPPIPVESDGYISSDFIAESIEYENGTDVAMAEEINELATQDLDISSEDESEDDGGACPSLSDGSTPESSRQSSESAQLPEEKSDIPQDIFNLSALQGALPQTPAEKTRTLRVAVEARC